MDEPVTLILDSPKRGEGATHPLAAWRELRGLSQKRFGEMARTAASTISRIENNKMRPKPELERISAVMNQGFTRGWGFAIL